MQVFSRLCTPVHAGYCEWYINGVHAYYLHICHCQLLTMNNIKLFGTTIQENINNSMWNYGAALSLIMLFLIGATTLLASDDKDHNEGGGLW